MLECVLFDLDGLLVDSEPLQFHAYRRALEQFGVRLDLDAWIRWHSVEASTRRWVRDRGLDLDPEELRSVKKRHYDDLVATELQLKPGARALVERCAGEFELAVVSSSRRESIESCLRKFGLAEHFTAFVSGAELARSKPYPDAYLAALETVNCRPQNAIALEDSATGYRAAAAAGVACIVCPDFFIPKATDAFIGAARVVESLAVLDPGSLRAIHQNCRGRG